VTSYRSCWMVLSHVMRGRPRGLLQSPCGETNKILLPSTLSSMHAMCPNRVSRRAWIRSEFRLLCLPPNIIISDKVITFDAQQHSKAPLVERFDPTNVCLQTGKLAGCTCYTALASLWLIAVTSRSSCLDFAWLHELRHCDG